MKIRAAAAAAFFLALPPSLFAGIFFEAQDIGARDEILFTARHSLPGASLSYTTLFCARLSDGGTVGAPLPVTCYPERMSLVSGGTAVEIKNRYGRARYDLNGGTLKWLDFRADVPLECSPAPPFAASPDGKWICFTEKTGFVEGRLFLARSGGGKSVLVEGGVAFSYEQLPVKWSGDSSCFVYCKDGVLYFCDPEAAWRGIQIDGKWREIGEGSIDSADWTGGDLFFIEGDTLRKISASGIYTAGLYSKVIGRGIPCGRLPNRFDPSSDSFSVSPDGSRVMVSKSNADFALYNIESNSDSVLESVFSRRLDCGERSAVFSRVIWRAGRRSAPCVWLREVSFADGGVSSALREASGDFPEIFSSQSTAEPEISPDRSRAAFFSDGGVDVYETSLWKRIARLEGENAVSALWLDNSTLCAGGVSSTRKWDVASGKSETLFLSSARSGRWSGDGSRIAIDAGGAAMSAKVSFGDSSFEWSEGAEDFAGARSMQNGRYRIFCGAARGRRFDNAIYARKLWGEAVTRPIYKESAEPSAPGKKIALVFEVAGGAENIPRALCVLRSYNVKGSFFLNGDFIARHPRETKQIAASGNLCASLFFSDVDLTDSLFNFDAQFVRRGLARVEDEFFDCAKKELSPFWRAPRRAVTEKIKAAGRSAGYEYVDAIYSDDEGRSSVARYVAAIGREDAKAIALRADGPMLKNLDLLVSAILDSGCAIVGAEELE